MSRVDIFFFCHVTFMTYCDAKCSSSRYWAFKRTFILTLEAAPLSFYFSKSFSNFKLYTVIQNVQALSHDDSQISRCFQILIINCAGFNLYFYLYLSNFRFYLHQLNILPVNFWADWLIELFLPSPTQYPPCKLLSWLIDWTVFTFTNSISSV